MSHALGHAPRLEESVPKRRLHAGKGLGRRRGGGRGWDGEWVWRMGGCASAQAHGRNVHLLTHSRAHSLPRALTPSLTHSLTRSLPLTHAHTHSRMHSPTSTHSPICSISHFVFSLTCLFVHSLKADGKALILTHTPTHFHTHDPPVYPFLRPASYSHSPALHAFYLTGCASASNCMESFADT